MCDRNLRWLLWIGCLLCLATGIGVLFAALAIPTSVAQTTEVSSSPQWIKPRSVKTTERTFSEEDFQYSWHKRLQRQLVDPPPPEKTEPKPQVTQAAPVAKPVQRIPLQIKLLGTLIDNENEYIRACIEHQGETHMVEAGDTIEKHPGRPIVIRISEREIVVELTEQSHTVTLNDPNIDPTQ